MTESGYTTPTPIQQQAIPVVLAGKDVMGGAQTGTGKTAGFALPILQKLAPMANTSPSPARHPVRALILTPTRELAVQVEESFAGILTALGIALQLPAQFAVNMAVPMFNTFSLGGSILFGAGLTWIGWSLWSDGQQLMEEPHLSTLDRSWGAPVVVLAALFLILNAYANTFAALSLPNGIINLISMTTLLLSCVVLFIVQAGRAGTTGWLGLVFTHLGAALSVIPAYLIVAQLAGRIESNRALTATWVDLPFGRAGNYMLILGMLLFGISVIRAGVFPGWTGWLVVIGIALFLPFQFQSQAYLYIIFWAIGATLEGIGLGWMGWMLFRNHDTRQLEQPALNTIYVICLTLDR